MRVRTRRMLAGAATVGACAALVCAVQAQAPKAPALGPGATAEIQHIHLRAPDPEAAVQWYASHMVCAAWARKDSCRTNTSTQFNFLKGTPKGGSQDTGIDHLGFSFTDVAAKLRELEAAGVKVLAGPREVPGLFTIAFVEDPWGTRIELVEDRDALGFHHVHLRSAEPAGALAWYERMFGGERTKFRGRLEGLRYGQVWILASPVPRTAGAILPTEGRSADHIGWGVADIAATTAYLAAQGVERSEPRAYTEPYTKQKLRFSLLTGPDGVRVEVVQLE